jgi:NAD(P)H-flavin reductase
VTVYSRPLPVRPLPPLSGAPARAPGSPNATLVARDDLTETLAVFTVVLDQPLGAFRPGQYVPLGVARDGELVHRP